MSTTEPESDQTLELLGALLGACESTGIDYSTIPTNIMEGLKNYAEEGVPVGDFLRCVISNDFLMAVGRADRHSMRALPSIASYVYMEMPGRCHGSPAVYRAWIDYHRAKLTGEKSLERTAYHLVVSAKDEAEKWSR